MLATAARRAGRALAPSAARAASSHAENTNTFIREVRERECVWGECECRGACVWGAGGVHRLFVPSLSPCAVEAKTKNGGVVECAAWAGVFTCHTRHKDAAPRAEGERKAGGHTGGGAFGGDHKTEQKGMGQQKTLSRPLTRADTPRHDLPPPSPPQALVQLEYPDKLQRLLLTPQREVLVELVITRDSGEIETFNAYRVQHDDSRGPFKGGLRYHPQVSVESGVWGERACVSFLYPFFQPSFSTLPLNHRWTSTTSGPSPPS